MKRTEDSAWMCPHRIHNREQRNSKDVAQSSSCAQARSFHVTAGYAVDTG